MPRMPRTLPRRYTKGGGTLTRSSSNGSVTAASSSAEVMLIPSSPEIQPAQDSLSSPPSGFTIQNQLGLPNYWAHWMTHELRKNLNQNRQRRRHPLGLRRLESEMTQKDQSISKVNNRSISKVNNCSISKVNNRSISKANEYKLGKEEANVDTPAQSVALKSPIGLVTNSANEKLKRKRSGVASEDISLTNVDLHVAQHRYRTVINIFLDGSSVEAAKRQKIIQKFLD
ncbi:hypothetical protein F5887DRAFT_917522 [Amanita rubescens]|nr:hypothetical protein F5887DRAFT_917522 [Amanita rubescens]